LINGMELHAESPLISSEVIKVAMDNGLLLVPAGPKVIRFVPPLIVTEAEIARALEAVEQSLASF
jgi:acetylornithine aminotransferase